jgi:hypothetical protein
MTLLLGAKCESGIVLSSDGLVRRLHTNGTFDVLTTTQTKLFPLQNRNIALSHHGQNVLEGVAITNYIARLDNEVKNLRHVSQIAAHIRDSLNAVVQKSLQKLRSEGIEDGCGFWIAGFDLGK